MAPANSRTTLTGPMYLSSSLRCFHSQGMIGSSLTYTLSPTGNATSRATFPESASPSSKAYSMEEMGSDSISLSSPLDSLGGRTTKGSTKFISSSSSSFASSIISSPSSSSSGSDSKTSAYISGSLSKGSFSRSDSGSESQSSLCGGFNILQRKYNTITLLVRLYIINVFN
ncbi:putative protein TPRXL [Camellia sinensis]|uniref:putative protein TPRXL n=1 Tax=Camellia sinensis TaxID=4442 RepID=UPI001035B1A2|nr:putative protein TPRXL [Camellia sinensis]